MTDGPFVESKEIVGGYSIVSADSIAAAAELAKGCPDLLTGGKVEVRTLAGLAPKADARASERESRGDTTMTTAQPEPVAPLVEHFFRREAGRLVAVLTRFFGWRNFDLVEEMVQATLVDALQSWRTRGIPENPSAWVHRVAKNKVLDSLRRTEIQRRVTLEWAANRPSTREGIDDLFLDTSIEDSQLRMIFACCHPSLARENQIAMTLKALCGFGISEIARALLVAEETVKKRLQRATLDLVDHRVRTRAARSRPSLIERLDAVHQVLYLIFNEGYSCSKGEAAIRVDLCEDAAHLCYLLCSHPRSQHADDACAHGPDALSRGPAGRPARRSRLHLAHGRPGSEQVGPALDPPRPGVSR